MKSLPKNRPKYTLSRIGNLQALALALACSKEHLVAVATTSNSLYRTSKPILKPDGSFRYTFDALPKLKALQIRIKNQLLKRVDYPSYLTGSLKGRDYRSNASLHSGAKITICDDIEGFFPATSKLLVKNIWLHIFCFSEEVAEALTLLTTKDGVLPQGAATSSYLANLVFGDEEAILQEMFMRRGLTYSRYVDDISVSSIRRLSKDEQTDIIARVYGMLSAHGYRAKRSKHEIFTAGNRMKTTKLVNNRKASLPIEERHRIRAAVYSLEVRVKSGELGNPIQTELNRVTSRVGRLGGLGHSDAIALKARLKIIRGNLRHIDSEIVHVEPTDSAGVIARTIVLPWETDTPICADSRC